MDRTWAHLSTRSLGTISLVSLILGTIQTLKFIAKQLEKLSSFHRIFKTRFLSLILALLSRSISKFSSFVIVLTGIQGLSLSASASRCTSLFSRNLVLGLLTSTLTRIIGFVGRVFVSSTIAFILSMTDNYASSGVVLLLGAIVPFYVTGIFTSVFEDCVDSCFLCYLIDLEEGKVGWERAHQIFSASLK